MRISGNRKFSIIWYFIYIIIQKTTINRINVNVNVDIDILIKYTLKMKNIFNGGKSDGSN